MSITGSSPIRRVEECPVESGLARTRPSRWAGLAQVKAEAAPAVRLLSAGCHRHNHRALERKRLPHLPVIPMPVLARRRHEIGEPVEERDPDTGVH